MSGECANGVAIQTAINTVVAGAQAASIPVTARDANLFVDAADLAALKTYLASNGFSNVAYPWQDEYGPCLRYESRTVAGTTLAALGDSTPVTITVHVGTDTGL